MDHARFFVALRREVAGVPLHTWLPDAHTGAPDCGERDPGRPAAEDPGAYGLLRFVVPAVSRAPPMRHNERPVALVLAVIGIVYGAAMAFSQTDLKRLVRLHRRQRFTSGSALLLNLFLKPAGPPGAQHDRWIGHGPSTGGLSFIHRRRLTAADPHSRDLGRMGGLWAAAPSLERAPALFLQPRFTAGLPGIRGDFVGEVPGPPRARTRSASRITAVASLGVLAVHLLCASRNGAAAAFQGPQPDGRLDPVLTSRPGSASLMAVMIAGLLQSDS